MTTSGLPDKLSPKQGRPTIEGPEKYKGRGYAYISRRIHSHLLFSEFCFW